MRTRGAGALALITLLGTALPAVALYETPTRLSGEMPDFADASASKLSPDGQWLVFRSDRDVDGVLELWSVRLDGGDRPARSSASTSRRRYGGGASAASYWFEKTLRE